MYLPFVFPKFLLFIYLLSYYCCTGSTRSTYKKFLLQIIVEFTLPSLFIPLPHSCNKFNGSHFSIFTREFIVFPSHSPSAPFPYVPHLPPVPTPIFELLFIPVVYFIIQCTLPYFGLCSMLLL
jgi:hypothetical protein